MNNQDNKKTDSVYEELAEAVETLPGLHKQVLKMRYGLLGCTPCDYETIAKELSLSVEKVKELETDALRMLRHPKI